MPQLRVLAGPHPNHLSSITHLVNTNLPCKVSSDLFDGQIIANIKGFNKDTEYFDRDDRKGVTWSIQVQGRFLQPHTADDILFGNTFERPLHLPWGSGAALKFMSYLDPNLTHDLTSQTKPWALSPLVATMPHFAHSHKSRPPKFPSSSSLTDDNSQLSLAFHEEDEDAESPLSSASSSTSSLSSGSSSHSGDSRHSGGHSMSGNGNGAPPPVNLHTAAQRRSYFSVSKNRKNIVFGPEDIITTDFCYGFLEFAPSLTLRLPGGISFDLLRYWDGQPVRFMCCERKDSNVSRLDPEPWGRSFWCVAIEMVD
ncbi:hypothetical protein F5876DRAFT_88957 [Lentinula aff. lateritia]|uniref:Uncharacterized protein n=1 Tax=Lentinula aff. lateritia TaxID=2804960 RepID=A0ACC1U0J1_9AGAR|nr:hypothetical protein F5876DRAFT_88957 [Lentinula aff. lateritia]